MRTKFNLREDIKKNKKSREEFIDFWANYVKTHSDKEWSRQQNVLIDSQIQSARAHKWTVEEYKKMLGDEF